MTVHVGFTGTQAGMTEAQFLQVGNLLLDLGATDLHHGDCFGADADAHKIATQGVFLDVIHVHPPTNPGRQALCAVRFGQDIVYPKKSYLERNRDIVDSACALIATPKEMTETLRSGTWATIRHARKIGKPVWIVWPDGTVSAPTSP